MPERFENRLPETQNTPENKGESLAQNRKSEYLPATKQMQEIADAEQAAKEKESLESFMEDLGISETEGNYLVEAEQTIQQESPENANKDLYELCGQGAKEEIKNLFKEVKSRKQKEEFTLLKDKLKEKGTSNTKILDTLITKHNEGEILIPEQELATLKQWQTLLSMSEIPEEIRSTLPQKINGSNVDLFSNEGFSTFVTTEIFESDQIDEKQKQEIAEKLQVPYIRRGSQAVEFGKKFAEKNPGQSFDLRGHKVKPNTDGTLEIQFNNNRDSLKISSGVMGPEVGKRMNYALLNDVLEKYKLHKLMPQRINPNSLHDQNEELPVQNIQRTETILALVCPEHRRGEILSQANLNRITQSLRMFRENPDLMSGGLQGGTDDLRKLGILEEGDQVNQEKMHRALLYAGNLPRDKFVDLQRFLDGDREENEETLENAALDEKWNFVVEGEDNLKPETINALNSISKVKPPVDVVNTIRVGNDGTIKKVETREIGNDEIWKSLTKLLPTEQKAFAQGDQGNKRQFEFTHPATFDYYRTNATSAAFMQNNPQIKIKRLDISGAHRTSLSHLPKVESIVAKLPGEDIPEDFKMKNGKVKEKGVIYSRINDGELEREKDIEPGDEYSF